MPYPFGVLLSGKPISFASIYTEFNAQTTARGAVTMSDYYTFAGVATNVTTISMSQFHGKSATALPIGDLYYGGTSGLQKGGDYTTVTDFAQLINSANDWRYVSSTSGGGCAVDSAGRLWTWGQGGKGQLGGNSTISRSTPVQVGTATNWRYATVSNSSYTYPNGVLMAINTSNQLYTCGSNDSGELGNSSTIARSSPVLIAGSWLQTISNGENRISMGVKTDGTLWSWGNSGSFYEAGRGSDFSDRSSPVQIGTATTWKFVTTNVYNSAALQTDGTLWCWGEGNSGPALPTTNHASTPIQATGNDWWKIACGMWHGAGIKSDGRLFTWGRNEPALGKGTISGFYSSPSEVSIGGAWKHVACGYQYTVAVRIDGTVWYAGYDILRPSSPVTTNVLTQRGSGDTWKFIASEGPYGTTVSGVHTIF